MNRRFLLIFPIAIVILYISNIYRTAAIDPTERTSGSSPIAPSISAPAPKPAPSSAVSNPSRLPSSSPAPNPNINQTDIKSVLKRYSGTEQWVLDREADGTIFKISSGQIKGLLKSPEGTRDFLSDLSKSLGFQDEPLLRRDEKSADRVHIVDYYQMQADRTGDPIPVFDAWIRLMANPEGDVFLISNQLKPVDSHVVLSAQISSEEALAIAKAYINNPDAKLEIISPLMVFAGSRPHQIVTQVGMSGVLPHKLLLVGHESRAVVHEKIMSRY